MAEIFILFCCRSCLKGENDNKELYEVLGIDKKANIEVIKKAYRKLSLTLHPDRLTQRGITVSLEDSQKFLKLKDAYDILSDPKRRRLYDKIGMNGLKILENPSEVDPTLFIKNFQNNKKDRVGVGLMVALIFCFILYLPVMFCLKCDGTLDDQYPWVAVWIPVWMLDIVLLAAAILMFMEKNEDSNKNENGSDDEDEDSMPKLHIPFCEKVLNLFESLFVIFIQIFVIIRLDGFIGWSWFIVFLPWFLYEATTIVSTMRSVVTTIPKPDLDAVVGFNEDGDDEDTRKFLLESTYFNAIMSQSTDRKSVAEAGYRIWQAVFLAMKLNGTADWNWGLVLLPVWAYILTELFVAHMYSVWGKDRLKGLDLEELMQSGAIDPAIASKIKQAESMESSSSTIYCMQAVPLFIAILLVSRLQPGVAFSSFLVLLPIFIIIGCCCCGVFCGIACLANVDADAMAEEFKNIQRGGDADVEKGEGDASSSAEVVHVPPPPAYLSVPSEDVLRTSPSIPRRKFTESMNITVASSDVEVDID